MTDRNDQLYRPVDPDKSAALPATKAGRTHVHRWHRIGKDRAAADVIAIEAEAAQARDGLTVEALEVALWGMDFADPNVHRLARAIIAALPEAAQARGESIKLRAALAALLGHIEDGADEPNDPCIQAARALIDR